MPFDRYYIDMTKKTLGKPPHSTIVAGEPRWAIRDRKLPSEGIYGGGAIIARVADVNLAEQIANCLNKGLGKQTDKVPF